MLITGLKEPLRSQVQLRVTSATRYADIREWVLQYENVNAPWRSSVSGKGAGGGSSSGPQPMEVDQVTAWKGGKGKDKGKGKYIKGTSKDKGKGGKKGGGKHDGRPWQRQQQHPQSGKGKDSNKWSQPWRGNHQDPYRPGKAKGKGAGASSVCHNCGQAGHWKNECPKGKQKGVHQVEETQSQAPLSSSHSISSTSATAYRTPSAVHRVQAVEQVEVNTPPGCRVTRIFDISEVESDVDDFALVGSGVMVVSMLDVSSPSLVVHQMDCTDDDGNWTSWTPSNQDVDLMEPASSKVVEVNMVAASPKKPTVAEVVLDSGADVLVAPLHFAKYGKPSGCSGVIMQDAQGKRIPEVDSRILEIEVTDTNGEVLKIKEKFSIANVGSLILSLGRLLRGGWNLSHRARGQVIVKDGCEVPIKLRRNTLVMAALVSAIAAFDTGPLPPQAEELAHRPGWHILPSGLPLLVAHRVEEIPYEGSVWSADDWSWVAVFVRRDPAIRLPQPGDVWVQVMALPAEVFEEVPKKLVEIEAELEGRHDVCVVFHVEELAKDLLSSPSDVFREPSDEDPPFLPAGAEEAGNGMAVEEVFPDNRPLRGEEEEPRGAGIFIDDVKIDVETPLKTLRSLCERLELPKSGSKNKVLQRLKLHHEVLQKQMATEIAQKMFKDQERDPTIIKAPILPSAMQQELHAVTHQPFQPWCQACVMGRSRQSPHERRDPSAEDEKKIEAQTKPCIQIDYCFTFTKERVEGAEELDDDIEDGAEAEKPDYRDQYGLNLIATESTTGWVICLPILAKGTSSLKKVTEALVRLSMQVGGGDEVVFQGDPESSIKQILNSVEACRARLGLRTQLRLVATIKF